MHASHPTLSPRAPHLAGVASALPPHAIAQSDARAFAARLFERALGRDAQRLLAVFDHSGIETRYACMPLEWYEADHDFGATNDCYIEHALALARTAALAALDRAGFTPADVTHLMFVSSTGVATPTVDARLATSSGFARGVRRVPIWGLGCAGGCAGLARAADFARDPDAVVLVVALELCSLAFRRQETDARSIVASALFSDGAAAAVVAGAGHPRRSSAPAAGVTLEIAASGSTLWPETLDIMGWTVDGAGLHVVFSRDIPAFVRQWVRTDLEGFLGRHGVMLTQLDHFVAHPGGPKVLEAYVDALALQPGNVRHARDVLRRYGNMSSPTCLFVLEAVLASGDVNAGHTALLAALGPGFASEYVLMRAVAESS